uniref:Uncharacterized protein n=1 Tax=Noccaea caerulescens TaxID=107243 RepID=A0A1J3JJ33_NOCCA
MNHFLCCFSVMSMGRSCSEKNREAERVRDLVTKSLAIDLRNCRSFSLEVLTPRRKQHNGQWRRTSKTTFVSLKTEAQTLLLYCVVHLLLRCSTTFVVSFLVFAKHFR